MKPERFSIAAMYGNKGIFEQRLKEGYDQVAFGNGQWVETRRIVAIWAFFHPSSKIVTYEHPKSNDMGPSVRGNPFQREYTAATFQQYCELNKITMDEKMGLAELLRDWE